MVTCCKDCEERHPACHDHCEKYIRQKAEIAEIKRKQIEANDIESAIAATKSRLYWRIWRCHRR